jgi:Ca2+-binding RTX toxin-like protein
VERVPRARPEAASLDGGGGDDTLVGGDGDDMLVGGAGDDRIDGGAGNDRAIYAISISGAAIRRDGDAVIVTTADGTDRLTLVETLVFADGSIRVSSLGSDNTVFGSRFDDFLAGTNDRDGIIGYDGDDRIQSMSGADAIDAGPGDDIVLAGGGDDHILGGDGADRLCGEKGDDFIFGDGSVLRLVHHLAGGDPGHHAAQRLADLPRSGGRRCCGGSP